jgi:hypothetical protein
MEDTGRGQSLEEFRLRGNVRILFFSYTSKHTRALHRVKEKMDEKLERLNLSYLNSGGE